jgi:hypothetical protein
VGSSRRHVVLTVVPLAVIALGFFASVLVPYGYPPKWMTVVRPFEELSPFLIIHAGAAGLALAIAHAARRGSSPGALAIVSALIGILAATIMTGIAVGVFVDAGYWTHALAFAAPVAVALVLAFHALRLRGWDRVLFAVGAFAIAVLPYGCPLIPGMFNLFSAGLAYLAADLTLLVVVARGMRTRP